MPAGSLGKYYELIGSLPAGELVEPLDDAAEASQAAGVFKDDAFVTACGERLGVHDAAVWTA